MDFASLPRHPMADSDLPTELPCEGCGQHLPGIRSTPLPLMIFVVYYIYVNNDAASLCPPCARWALMRNTLFNLFTANLLSPVILVMNGITFAGTFFRKTT